MYVRVCCVVVVVPPVAKNSCIGIAMEEPWSFTLGAKRSQKRARFNLLALEHDEYYFQVLVHRNEERDDSDTLLLSWEFYAHTSLRGGLQ